MRWGFKIYQRATRSNQFLSKAGASCIMQERCIELDLSLGYVVDDHIDVEKIVTKVGR